MKQNYAIIETGSKQYKVSAGQAIDVEHLGIAEGEDIELSRVLFIADEEDFIAGNPIVEGARVTATSLGDRKGDKVIIFKYKSKVRYCRKKGHRQLYTRLKIKQVVKPEKEVAVKKTRRKKPTGVEANGA